MLPQALRPQSLASRSALYFTDASDVEILRFSVAENSTSGSLGFIKDTKAGSSPNFSLTSSHFNVHATDGIISVAGGAMLDFEAATEHLLNIEVGEGGETFTRSVAVQITNVLGRYWSY